MKGIVIRLGCILLLLITACQFNENNAWNVSPETKTNLYANDSLFIYIDTLNSGRSKPLDWQELAEKKLSELLTTLRNQESGIQESVFESLLAKISQSTELGDFFAIKIPFYLNDPLSPYYDNQLFVAFLKATITCEGVDEQRKNVNKALLKLIDVNRVGQPANDFEFENLGSELTTLHQSSGNFLILFFFDPLCSLCKEQLSELQQSQAFSNLLKNTRTSLLLINPWGNYESWKRFGEKMPKSWEVGIDKNQSIIEDGLYYLKAAPSIYLLANDKRVLLKNTDMALVINYLQKNNGLQ